jgi:hypothetical protein
VKTRHTIALAAAILMLLGGAWEREWSSGREAIRETDAAMSRGEVRDAVILARRAAEASVPGSPYAAMGYERLELLARSAEGQGRIDDAAFAWRAMRSAAVATLPASDSARRVDEADQGAFRVASARSLPPAVVPGVPRPALRHDRESDEPPSPWLLSALGWATLSLFAALVVRLGRMRRRGPWPLSP